ncbi:hypothetical protein [Nocardiopsis trehalosi]|uniref:hypothetical protein n=1 Tax=Nocardiopsis trehalosi TaxID=109329 RepID=UPI00082D60C3|nr:hypothetical protein [Nocardiopsis trehalosi]
MTDLVRTAGRADSSLRQLDRRLAALRAALHAGDRLPRHVPRLSPEQAADRAAAIRADRWGIKVMATLGRTPLGASPAPLDVGLLDLLGALDTDLGELEAAVRDAVAPDVRPAPPADRCAALLRLLPLVAARDEVLLAHVAREATRLARTAGRATGEAEAVERVPGRCPSCDAPSLLLRTATDLISCTNPACGAGWPRHRWPDLSGIVVTVPEAAAAARVATTTVYSWMRRGWLTAVGEDPIRVRLVDVYAAEAGRRVHWKQREAGATI